MTTSTAKIERVSKSYSYILSNMTVPQLAYANDTSAAENIRVGTPIIRDGNGGFHSLAIQYDDLAGTPTPAPNHFGIITHTGYQDTDATSYQSSSPTHSEGRFFYNDQKTMRVMSDDPYFVNEMGRTLSSRFINVSGGTLNRGDVCWISSRDAGVPNFEVRKASCYSADENYIIGVAATEAGNGEVVEFLQKGIVIGCDTSHLDLDKPVWLDTVSGRTTTTVPTYPCRHVLIGAVLVKDAVNGILGVNTLNAPYDPEFESTFVEKLDCNIVVTGGVIGLEVRADTTSSDKDFHWQMSGEYFEFDATTGSGTGGRARIEVAGGTSTVFKKYYFYADYNSGTPILTASETRPSTGYGMIAEATVLDATTTDSYGPLSLRRWTNCKVNGAGNDIGIIAGVTERLRLEGAKYDSGIDSTVSITTQPSALDDVNVTTTAGVAFQLWRQTLSSWDLSTDCAWVINASGSGTLTQMQRVTNLNQILELADGTAITNGNRYNITLIFAMNSDGEEQVYINLPTGVYASDSAGYDDLDRTAVTTVPTELKTTAFLGVRIPLKYTTLSSGTISFINGTGQPQWVDLFVLALGSVAVSATASAITSFPDSVFEVYKNTDDTAKLVFDCSGVSTATTRTLSALDVSGDIATVVSTPASASSSGVPGSIAYDNDYLYICIATDTWERAAISSWT